MAKIEKLTEEQEQLLIDTRNEWLSIGRSVKPLDKKMAEEAITNLYLKNGNKQPKFFWFPSPIQCCLAFSIIKTMNVKNLGANLGANLEDNLEDNLGANLEANLWANLRANLRTNIRANLRTNLWTNLEANLGANLGANLRNYYAASWWCNWEVWGDFGNKIGVPLSEKDRELLDLWLFQSRHCHLWWPFENIVFMSERPTILNIDERGRLHSENSQAMGYADGWGIWYWHGTKIPKEWIENKQSLTSSVALNWENVEQRRCACEIIGWDKVLSDPSLNPKIINEDQPHIGTLIEVDLPDAEKQWFIKYQCGTGRLFAESVNDKKYDTALKANAAGNGWRGKGDPESFIPFLRT